MNYSLTVIWRNALLTNLTPLKMLPSKLQRASPHLVLSWWPSQAGEAASGKAPECRGRPCPGSGQHGGGSTAAQPTTNQMNNINTSTVESQWIATRNFSVLVGSNVVWTKVEVTANVFSYITEETFQTSVGLINMETLTQLPPQNSGCLKKPDGSKMNWLKRCDCGRYI